MTKQNLPLIILMCFICIFPVKATENNETLLNTIKAIKKLTQATKLHYKEYNASGQKKFNAAIEEFEIQEKQIEEFLIKLETGKEEKELNHILNKYSNNKEQLI